MLDVDRREGGVTVSGLVAPPQLARGNRDEITLIVNGRPVRDTLLTQALIDALPAAAGARSVPGGRAPHRPAEPRSGRQCPSDQGVGALSLAAPGPGGASSRRCRRRSARAASSSPRRARHVGRRRTPADAAARAGRPGHGGGSAGAAADRRRRSRPVPRGAPRRSARGASAPSIGQLQDTFIVAASDDEVFFIDQHVAHERVLFERLERELARARCRRRSCSSRSPSSSAPGKAELLEEWAPTLDGPRLRPRGFRRLHASCCARCPRCSRARSRGGSSRGCWTRWARRRRDETAPLVHRALAFVACRAAIKAHAPLAARRDGAPARRSLGHARRRTSARTGDPS